MELWPCFLSQILMLFIQKYICLKLSRVETSALSLEGLMVGTLPSYTSSPRPQLRLLYCYPGPWRLFLVGEDTGTRELLGSWEAFPPIEEVEQAVFDKKGKPSATERVRASSKLFRDGM